MSPTGMIVGPTLRGPVPPDQTWRMEQFSLAYVQAVAAAAGCSAVRPDVDDDSIDLSLKRRVRGTVRSSPQLDLQVKATYGDCIGDGHLTYSLKLKNYDDLRDPVLVVPRILVVVHMPKDVEAWLSHGEEKLVLYRCGYWMSLCGMPESDNDTSQTVKLPRNSLLSVESLDSIFVRLAAGDAP